jgi:hypothetical protein
LKFQLYITTLGAVLASGVACRECEKVEKLTDHEGKKILAGRRMQKTTISPQLPVQYPMA